MTEYVILFKREDGGWQELDKRIPARSGQSAIRALLSESSHPDSEWVAVPSRSFQPVTVKVETKTALKFS